MIKRIISALSTPSNLHLKIVKVIRNMWVKNAIKFLNFGYSGSLKAPTQDQITTLKYSAIAGKNQSLDTQKIYLDWERSNRLWNEGSYTQACKLQIQCLDTVIKSQQISPIFEPPQMMSVGWSAAIGHLGFLGIFSFAQQFGLVPSNKRLIPVKNIGELESIRMLFTDSFTATPYNYGSSIMENPSQWHVSERLSIIRNESGYLPLYELTESVFNHPNYSPTLHSLKLPDSYQLKCKEALEKLGLPRDAWFVGLHVREKPDMLDARNGDIETYLPAINEVTQTGGWVIRFGTGKMKPLPTLKNVIDLCPDNRNYTKLHFYLLAAAKFLIITTSGPAELAKSFGTKILGTNTTSVGRNILSATPGSIYIPKRWESKGRKVSYLELITNKEGYAETNLKTKSINGYQVYNNSSEEIRMATREMLISEMFSDSHQSNLAIQRIQANAVGRGKIANSYLEMNHQWFLRS